MKSRYSSAQRARIETDSFIENLVGVILFTGILFWLFVGFVDGMGDAGPHPTAPGTSYAARIVQWSPTYQAFVRCTPYVASAYRWFTEPRP